MSDRTDLPCHPKYKSEQYLDDKRKDTQTVQEQIDDLWQAIRELEQKIARVKNGLDNLSQFI